MLHYSDKEHQALRHLERQIDREVDSIGPFDIFHRLAVAHELTYARLRELRFCFDQSVTLAYCDLCVAFESIDLRAMLPAILSIVREMLLIYAVSITAGAVVGGMFTGGIATAAGAAAGMEIATLVLTAMGLTCIAETFVKAIAHLTSDYSAGVLDTWSAVRYDEYSEQVVIDEGKLRRAKHTLAGAHTKLVIALLTAIALYVSKGQLKILTAEVRTGRLGERFAGWLERNAGKLEQHPLLHRDRLSPANAGNDVKMQDYIRRPKQQASRLNPEEPEAAGPSTTSKKLQPGTIEHKADRWEKYQRRGGTWNYERWSAQYDTNMRNSSHGLAREALYRENMGAEEVTLKTPFTNRQIDIYKPSEDYLGQLKTGRESLTVENIQAIKKDGWLVKEGYSVEHILEKGASKNYLDALDDAGIAHKIGPQIP